MSHPFRHTLVEAVNMFTVRNFVLVLLVLQSSTTGSGQEPGNPLIEAWLTENLPAVVGVYKELHAAPELSLQEEKTATRMADELRKIGAEVTTGIGGHGVVGVLKNGPGKALMYRADMDALPVTEQTGLPYASQVKVTDDRGAVVGVMHACGHDIHMASLIGVARLLAQHKDLWSGTVIFLCQPAEERGAGAEAMLNDGLLVRFPRPDFAVALHVGAESPTGSVGVRSGYSMANVDSIDITIKGRGGHGAYPETAIDPIVIAARLILDLQTIVSREIKPIEPAVITVGAINGGTKHNIIPDDCKLQITVRSYSAEVRQQLWDAIRRKANAAAASSGAPEPEVEISEGTPSLYNDPALSERVAETLRKRLGAKQVESPDPSMGGEDFGRYGLAGVPICMFRLGSVPAARLDEFAAKKQPPPSLHSPLYYPEPESTLRTGIVSMAAIVADLLPPQKASE
ncbi:MAG: amidohydrolase [Pirellulales bacterium]